MRIVSISDYGRFKRYKDRWHELFARSGADNVFLTYEWIDACIRYFCKDQELLILNVFKGDRLIGIAPLAIRKYKYFGLPVRVCSFIGTTISDRMDFILAEHKKEAIGLILDYLMERERKWDFIDLQEIAGYTGNIEIIKKWVKDRGAMGIMGPSTKSFFIEFNGNKELLFQKFLKKFNAKFKKESRNNKCSSSRFKFERHIGNNIEAEKLFPGIIEVESHSWKGDKGSGIFSKVDSREFHREILDRFSKNRWLDLSIMSLDERPIAYIYNYLYGQRAYNYSIAYDKRYSAISPGTLLMLWALKDSSVRDISEYDFARGEGSWKSRLTEDFRLHNRVRIFKHRIYSRFLYQMQSRLMPYLKGKRMLYRMWMRVKEIAQWN